MKTLKIDLGETSKKLNITPDRIFEMMLSEQFQKACRIESVFITEEEWERELEQIGNH